jgi:glyoxylase-like metal-dependent hydrolase (beta-lactamase superfamily II)
MNAATLPAGITVFERGWLSSNNILIQGRNSSALIDSGYCTHAQQTLALIADALQGQSLDLLINTHLHSDHCGGNAALQAAYPDLQTHIPPGHAGYVRAWDAHALSYTPTGQSCPQFGFSATLKPGTEIQLADLAWQVHAAPGHDPHSVILLEPVSRTLVSADALWEQGFGVVFPELDGVQAFDEVGATLDLIERLKPVLVVPGHGTPFAGVAAALAVARKRLAGFVAAPEKHRRYAAKVLLKFKLLEAQALERDALLAWALGTSYFAGMLAQHAGPDPANNPVGHALDDLVSDLVRSAAATLHGSRIFNA